MNIESALEEFVDDRIDVKLDDKFGSDDPISEDSIGDMIDERLREDKLNDLPDRVRDLENGLAKRISDEVKEYLRSANGKELLKEYFKDFLDERQSVKYALFSKVKKFITSWTIMVPFSR